MAFFHEVIQGPRFHLSYCSIRSGIEKLQLVVNKILLGHNHAQLYKYFFVAAFEL